MILLIPCFLMTMAAADHLPNQTPENQVFSVDTVLDVTGAVDDTNSLKWVVASPGAIPTGILENTQSIADVTYKDSILTNGGKMSESKNFAFDSQDKAKGRYNLETDKVLTYAGTGGAHLVGEEEYILNVAGNFVHVDDTIRCVFSHARGMGIPAFCNIISARSNLININSAQVSTKGVLRAVTDSVSVPTEMSYQIAVSPDANAGSGFAEGTVSTAFTGSIMESRNGNDYASVSPQWNRTATERTWKDETTVTGGIKNFRKVFGDPSYLSGILDPTDAPPFDSDGSSPPSSPPSNNGIITIRAMDCQGSYNQARVFTFSGQGGSFTTPYTFSNMPAGKYTATTEHIGTISGTLVAGGSLTLTFPSAC